MNRGCIRYEAYVVVLSFVFRCIQRKNLLQLLKPDDLTLLETAPKRWTSLDSPRGEDRISGNPSLPNGHSNRVCSVNCLHCIVHKGIF